MLGSSHQSNAPLLICEYPQVGFSGLAQPTQSGVRDCPQRTGTLELAFASKSLRTICENQAHARRELGPAVSEILKHRLADLLAATSVKDLIAGRPRVLDGTDTQQITVDLCNGYRMVFCANHSRNPFTEAGQIDWNKVSRVKVLRIERDHV